MNQKKLSVIVTTYNWPEALKVTLDSMLDQSTDDFELVIGDDGSGGETKDLIAEYAARAPFPIKHYWHPDEGYRVAATRNGAVALSTGDYLIFTDGDCGQFPDFVATHRAFAEAGWFVTGRRSFVNRRLSALILKHGLQIHKYPRLLWFFLALLGQCNRPFQFLRLPMGVEKRKAKSSDPDKAQTCSLSVWRDDFMSVDGFDEGYYGYGGEDTDLVVRLIRNKVHRKTADYTSPVLHMFHPRRKDDADVAHRGPSNLQKLLNDPDRIQPYMGYSTHSGGIELS